MLDIIFIEQTLTHYKTIFLFSNIIGIIQRIKEACIFKNIEIKLLLPEI
jgi:hypothetical protein